MTDYGKMHDRQTKCMYFLIEYDDLLGKYNTIWYNTSSTDIKKEMIAILFTIKNIWKPK